MKINSTFIFSRTAANLLGVIFVLLSIVGLLCLEYANIELIELVSSINKYSISTYAPLIFICVVLISQFLVIPSGSLLMIAGGFLFGSIPATLAYTALLPFTGAIIGKITRSSSLGSLSRGFFTKHPKISRLTELLAHEPFTLSVVLRITPILPAAIAAISASILHINNRTFILATVCVGWIRPLFFASMGEAMQAVYKLEDSFSDLREVSLLPLSLLALSAVLNLWIRCWLRSKRAPNTD